MFNPKSLRSIIFLSVALVVGLPLAWFVLSRPAAQPPAVEKNPPMDRQAWLEYLTRRRDSINASSNTGISLDQQGRLELQRSREKRLRQIYETMPLRLLSAVAPYNNLEEYILGSLEEHKLRDAVIKKHEAMFILTREQLPFLYSLLKDNTYALYHHNIARMIAAVGRDDEAADNLWDYFQNPLDWEKSTSQNAIWDRLYALLWIGQTGSSKYDEVLRKASTLEGAEELARDWIDNPVVVNPRPGGVPSRKSALERISASAIKGLIMTRRPENIAFVKQLHQKMLNQYLEDKKLTVIFTDVCESMAINDYINEFGMENYYIIASYDLGLWQSVINPYLEKYLQPIKQNIKKQ